MARVFISHSSRDNVEALELATWLKARGFEQGFLDIDKHQGIPPGDRWEQKLYDELERAQAVILLLTKNWFDSKWCFAEFAQARSRGKAIFPVVTTFDGDQFVGDDLQKLDLTKDREGGLERLADRLTEVALLSQGGFEFPAGRAPYPGFLAFDESDAAVYFGRDDDIRRLIQRLDSRRIERGRRFVLVLGESGTGKSSLIRAGLIPRLQKAKREWIVLHAFRPEADPFVGLALSLEDAGFEVTATDLPYSEPAAIAGSLATAHGARRAGILVPLDQAEELFTRTPPERRQQFLTFLSRLLEPGLPFVAVATLRSDHLGDIQTATGLTAEFEDFALRPLLVERIADIVRGPARVAGVDVEDELVARIMQDARTPDALPLVAYALRRLYDQFGSDNRLQLVEYESLRDAAAGLSPLETIVRDTAERVLADEKSRVEEVKALREAFIPGLVRVNDEGGFVRQAARWEGLPGASHRLVAALAGPQARLLVIRDKAGVREVEVAHEALFRVWPLLVRWLAEEKDFLIGRNRLERALADWHVLPEADREKGLITGILLNRATGWLTEHPARFSDEEAAFIRSSDAAEAERSREAEAQRRALDEAKLHQAETERDSARALSRRTRIAAGVLGVVALIAIAAGVLAMRAQDRAVAALAAGTETAERMVVELAREFRDQEGVTADLVTQILDRALSLQRQLALLGGSTPRLLNGIASALSEIAQAYLQTGSADTGTGIPAARTAAGEARDIAERLVSIEPENAEWAGSLVRANIALGDALLRAGEEDAAFERYQDGLSVAERIADLRPEDFAIQRDLALSLNRVADSLLPSGKTGEALALYERSLRLREALLDKIGDDTSREQDVVLLLRDLAISTAKVGDLHAAAGRHNEAYGFYERSLQLRQDLVELAPDNTRYQRDLAVGFQRLGAAEYRLFDYEKALAYFNAALEINTNLIHLDSDRLDWRHDVSVSNENIADALLQLDRLDEARAAMHASLTIREELVERDTENLVWKRALATALRKMADIDRRSGDTAEAINHLTQALQISEALAAHSSENVQFRLDVVATLIGLMTVALAPRGTSRIKALYQSLRDDVAFVAGAPVSDSVLSAAAASALHAEARLLDARAFDRWLSLWDEDASYWVPLSPEGDPETDQALFLDDHRRLRERVWRMHDKSAWALHPQGDAVRLVGGVEAWPIAAPDEIIVASAMTLQYVRLQSVFTTAGRQIHRLRRGADGWRLTRKILLLPAQAAGTPHLGWLL